MKSRKFLFFAPLALGAFSLTACVSLFGGEPVKIRPVDNMSGLTTAGRDPLYESAVVAINARDYARALNYLQGAKAKDPSNIKVLNALGVVYDKLGRFDLSARYYAQASAVDPQSRIVAENMGYSRVLQGLQGVDEHSAVAALEAPGGASSPTERPTPPPPPAAAVVAHGAPAENQPIIAASSSPSITSGVTFAPDVKSVMAPVVVVSIPANVVAPAAPVMEKKPAVLLVHTASIVPVAQPAEKQTMGAIAPPAAKPELMGEVVTAANPPVNLVRAVPVTEKPAVTLPVHTTFVAPIARPAEKQTVAVIAPPAAKPELKGEVITAANPPANLVRAVPVTENPAVALPVHTASVAPVARPAEKQTVAVIAPPAAKPELKGEVVTAANPPANLVRAVPVTEKPAVALPVHTASVAPVSRPAEKQTVAVIAHPATKPELKGEAVTAANPSANLLRAVPVTEKPAVALPVHTASVAPVARQVEKPNVALIAPPVAMHETTRGMVIAPSSPARLVRAVPVTAKPVVVLPARSVSIATVAHPQKGRAVALSTKSVVKPEKPMIARPLATPAAFRAAVGPAVPVNRVLSVPAGGKILMVGKPVKILNASGRPGGTGPVSRRLIMLGWSVRQSDWRMQSVTTLYYPSKNIMAARAMLRTLPFPARFVQDNNDASAMRLVIGRDYLSWKPKNSRLAALWKKGSVVAFLQAPLTGGNR